MSTMCQETDVIHHSTFTISPDIPCDSVPSWQPTETPEHLPRSISYVDQYQTMIQSASPSTGITETTSHSTLHHTLWAFATLLSIEARRANSPFPYSISQLMTLLQYHILQTHDHVFYGTRPQTLHDICVALSSTRLLGNSAEHIHFAKVNVPTYHKLASNQIMQALMQKGCIIAGCSLTKRLIELVGDMHPSASKPSMLRSLCSSISSSDTESDNILGTTTLLLLGYTVPSSSSSRQAYYLVQFHPALSKDTFAIPVSFMKKHIFDPYVLGFQTTTYTHVEQLSVVEKEVKKLQTQFRNKEKIDLSSTPTSMFHSTILT